MDSVMNSADGALPDDARAHRRAVRNAQFIERRNRLLSGQEGGIGGSKDLPGYQNPTEGNPFLDGILRRAPGKSQIKIPDRNHTDEPGLP